jgi:hypothetical protein
MRKIPSLHDKDFLSYDHLGSLAEGEIVCLHPLDTVMKTMIRSSFGAGMGAIAPNDNGIGVDSRAVPVDADMHIARVGPCILVHLI